MDYLEFQELFRNLAAAWRRLDAQEEQELFRNLAAAWRRLDAQEEEAGCGEMSNPTCEERGPIPPIVGIGADSHLWSQLGPGDEPVGVVQGHHHDDQPAPSVERIDAPGRDPTLRFSCRDRAHDLTIRMSASPCLLLPGSERQAQL